MILQCLHIFTLINISSEGTSLVQECTKYFIGPFLCLLQGTVPLLKMYQAYFYIKAIFHMQLLSVCLIECSSIGSLCHELRYAISLHRKLSAVEMMNYPGIFQAYSVFSLYIHILYLCSIYIYI